MVAAGGYAFVADWGNGGGLEIVDVGDPHNPQWAGTSGMLGGALTVHVANGVAYATDGYETVQVVIVSDAADPQPASAIETPGSADSLWAFDEFLYIADGHQGVQIVDVSDPYSSQLLKTFPLPENPTESR